MTQPAQQQNVPGTQQTMDPRPDCGEQSPSTMPPERVESFGGDTPLGRPGQPVELAPVYVLLASDEASYVSGARVAVTGGRPVL